MKSKRSDRRKPARPAAKRGLAPGVAVYVGEPQDWSPIARHLRYSSGEHHETEAALTALCPPSGPGDVHWFDVVGIHDSEAISGLGARFGVHPLVVEDVLNTSTRSKYEAHGPIRFVVARMLTLAAGSAVPSVISEQVSLLHGGPWVLSFQQRPGDVFDSLRKRIREAGGRVREMGGDYLLHALLDGIVDSYFEVLVALEDAVEELRQRALEETPATLVAQAQQLRTEAATVRRAALPLRDAVGRIQADADDFITPKALPYFGDLHDHLVQAVEQSEWVLDRLQSATELSLAAASHRANEAMRFLTVVASIFIPLTFVAGIYGMNFERMPELGWRWGYPGLLALMGGVGLAMVAWFRRRGWL